MLSGEGKIINFGNTTIFRQQYDLYFLPLKFFTLKYVKDPDLACDFIQDIFMNLWSSRKQFENEIAVKVFLYRSVRNSCLNYIRDSDKHERIHQDISYLQSEDAFTNNLIEAEIYHSLKTAFEALPENTRRIYQLSLDGKSHNEIAELLHISVNTVKKHKNMAHHLLRAQLKDLFLLILAAGI